MCCRNHYVFLSALAVSPTFNVRNGEYNGKEGPPTRLTSMWGAGFRMRRMMLGMSQEKLGGALGPDVPAGAKNTKRERNRIRRQVASNKFLRFLQVPVAFFFRRLRQICSPMSQGPMASRKAPSPSYVSEFPGHPGGSCPHQGLYPHQGGKTPATHCRPGRREIAEEHV